MIRRRPNTIEDANGTLGHGGLAFRRHPHESGRLRVPPKFMLLLLRISKIFGKIAALDLHEPQVREFVWPVATTFNGAIST